MLVANMESFLSEPMKKTEFVYILSSSYYQGILKIGRSKSHPEVRCRELTRQAGVLGQFRVEWYWEVSNSLTAEKILHHFFKGARVQPDKEFFSLGLAFAIKGANKALQSMFGSENLPKYQRLRDEELVIENEKIIEAIDALEAAKEFSESEESRITLDKEIEWLKQILE